MRILFINRMAATERGGGETFDLEIARHLAQRGHEVTFLSCIPLWGVRSEKLEVGSKKLEVGSRKSDLRPPTSDLRFITLRAPMFPWFPWDRVKAGWRVRVAEFWIFEQRAARWAWKRREQFDVIHVCELPTFVAKWKVRSRKSEVGSRKSDVGSRKSEVRPQASDHRPPVVMRLTAPNAYDPCGGIQKADAVIASGTSITKIRASVRADCFDVPNGVDLGRFGSQKSEAGSRKSDLGPRTSDLRLLYVARFQAFKNHAMLIRAFAEVVKEVPDTHLWLAGSGPLESDVKKLARDVRVDKQVRFMGEVPFDDLPGIYAQADIKVISSEYESFCFAAIEAMASGLPVVTTDCGWVPGLIGDTLPPIDKQWVDSRGEPGGRFENDTPGHRIREAPGGLVVGREHAEDLAQAMLRMAGDKALRERCGTWNRDKAVRDHGWESSAKKLEEVYERVIRDSGFEIRGP